MHILLIPSTYPSDRNSAKGIFYRDQALALCRAGHKVGVLVFDRMMPKRALLKMRSLSDFRTAFQISDDSGVRTYRITQWNWYPNSLRTHYIEAMSRAVLSAYHDYSAKFGIPDVIHAHNLIYGGYWGARIKEKTGLPLVLTEHSTNYIIGRLPSNRLPLIRAALQGADVRLAVGSALAEVLGRNFPDHPFSVLGNLVDTNFFVLSESQPLSHPFGFCTVCALVEKKGLDSLIHAFARAFHSQDVVLRIAGDGPQKEMLKALVESLGIQSRVEFLGQLSRNNLRSLLHASHAIVSSSRVETFGVNMIEALSCGRPAVATRSGGPETFINEKNGILVPVDDVDALADAMKQMVRTWQQYDPLEIRKDCIDRFSEKVIVGKLEGIYQQLVEVR